MIGGLLPPPGPQPRAPSRLAFLLAAAVAPLIFLLLGFWVAGQFREIETQRLLIRTSSERRVAAADLLLALTQAESAQRGYVITGDAAFLADYRSAIGQTVAGLSRLCTKGADRAVEAGAVARLQSMVVARSREMAAIIDLRRREGPAVAAARIASGEGKALMTRLNLIAADLSKVQVDKLRTRVGYMRGSLRDLEVLLLGLLLLASLLVLAGAGAFWQSRMRRYRSERDAHETATLLREVFTGNADAALLLDANGCIEAANAAAVRLFGYSYDDLVGHDMLSLFDVFGRGDFQTRIGLVGGQLTRPYWLDRVMMHREGHGIAVDIALGAMALNGATYVVATIRDIGERKTVERLKDEFLATVSHELRTPLTSVIGALGLLRSGSAGAMPQNAKRLVEIAENNSQRLIRLINDLLDIDKIGSGRMRFERAPFDLVGTAQAAIDNAKGLADDRGVWMELAAVQAPLVVDGDHDRLLQVLANLLSNAIRASPDGGLVLVGLVEQDGKVVVTVDDEGVGVPPEFGARIFERFAQASNALPGGSGLGLAISREIVVAHDGRIWFGDAPGGGARFAFSLPIARTQEPLRGSRPCILVGEADADTARAMCAMLESEDYGVECVSTESEIHAAAQTGRYDALVLDVGLPENGGLQIARTLHHRTDTRQLPVFIVSPTATFDRAHLTAGASGPVDWIDKPVDAAGLIAAVRRAIEHSVAARSTLLHIDADPDMLEIAAAVLAGHGRIVHATSIASARAVLATQSPDIVILDLDLPDGPGSDLLPDLRHADGTAIPTVIYSAVDVSPELEEQVEAVLIKSRRSLGSLARAIHRILATVNDDTTDA